MVPYLFISSHIWTSHSMWTQACQWFHIKTMISLCIYISNFYIIFPRHVKATIETFWICGPIVDLRVQTQFEAIIQNKYLTNWIKDQDQNHRKKKINKKVTQASLKPARHGQKDLARTSNQHPTSVNCMSTVLLDHSDSRRAWPFWSRRPLCDGWRTTSFGRFGCLPRIV